MKKTGKLNLKIIMFFFLHNKDYFYFYRSRQEYTELLLKDLCTYFSYNTFLMEKIMHLFPLEDLMSFLEASETPRPVTIRTNSLKTRRRDLAQVNILYYFW